MRKIVFELCAESIQACLAAREGGADRIELCSALSEGGLTPSHGLIRAAVLRSELPVHVLLRPRGGDFLYTEDEFNLMREDLSHARTLGATGFVLGILRADGTVDVERTRELVELAAPLEVTFHRAFDYTVSLEQALEDILGTGCRRILTSGGEPDVLAGAGKLAQLVQQAAGRIEIAVGGGLRIKDAIALARATGANHFHGSLRSSEASGMQHERNWVLEETDQFDGTSRFVVDVADVQAMIGNLRNA
ncbi:copper homeostasis protein CutC [Granulicella mallensis]|uniref:PF03932 family protein CutC n=1 Tax=Granulicella mallensis TaxID=940614 RepID=A0A7W8E985_9BACT|nr:copper homeostasis protein CutC [Granulicella mallensis]MBB5062090.1 copper homeostasis protein [Granulicella mallensis]